MIFDIKLERKNTTASNISSLRKVKNSDQSIRSVIGSCLKNSIHKNKSAWKSVMRKTVAEKPKNFQSKKSWRLIGFESMRKIVFPSISLNKSWLPTKSTPIIPKISIIPSPKSTITLSDSPIVKVPNTMEKPMNTKAKNKIM